MSLKFLLEHVLETLHDKSDFGVCRSWDVLEHSQEISRQTIDKELVDLSVDVDPVQKIRMIVFVPDERSENNCFKSLKLKISSN